MVVSAVMAALAIVLPMVFHAVGLGSHFLPMLLPLLLNAFLSSLGWSMLTAALVPWISAFVTGMPPIYPPIAAVMSAEAALMALTVGILWHLSGKRVWPTLIAGIFADRMASFLLTWALSSYFHLPAKTIAISAFLHGLPGVLFQLAVIPLVLRGLRHRNSVLFGDNNGQ